MVGGDPAVLTGCGNDLLTASMELFDGGVAVQREPVIPTAALGRARGTSVLAFASAVEAVALAAERLQSTLSEDGAHLQVASRHIDEVMNDCQPSGPAGPGGHGQVPV